ncbi:MAG TPA: response regulator transcription factor [Phenylobacterium sp.]|uniref:response regulator transcription factor n=1 Tax=Phenylobacterium sp. TaxID=1871053 RepID=UPI002B6B1F48|nr:response regulator transcription factor [Phenylobacterium sp.]HXA37531.1 response regulator transcription factor [Phenylobacterium sp.]
MTNFSYQRDLRPPGMLRVFCAAARAVMMSRKTEETAPRVLVVSDVFLYREGLSASLSRAGLNVVGAAPAARAEDAAQGIDVIVLDASLDGALRLARSLSARGRRKVIGFGIGDADEEVLACAEAGLAGFVPRDAGTEGFHAAIACAMRNEVRCSPRAMALIFARLAALAGPSAANPTPLTRREREVARLMAEGLSNKEIAGELRLGLPTVKNYAHTVLSKYGVRRRSAVAGHHFGGASADARA